MKIGVFGGTFDPPHIGHENIIAKLIDKFDKVIIIPSKKTPQKKEPPLADSLHRMRMLSMCSFVDNPNCMISNYEIMSKNSPSYAIDTIKYIKNEFKESDIYIVIGLDQLNNFNNWYKSEQILDIAKIICFNRPGVITDEEVIDCEFIDSFNYNISSSDIRSSVLNNNKNFKIMVDENIFNYIIKENLYK